MRCQRQPLSLTRSHTFAKYAPTINNTELITHNQTGTSKGNLSKYSLNSKALPNRLKSYEVVELSGLLYAFPPDESNGIFHIFSTCFLVEPVAMQPGKSGEKTEKPVFVFSIIIRYFISNLSVPVLLLYDLCANARTACSGTLMGRKSSCGYR